MRRQQARASQSTATQRVGPRQAKTFRHFGHRQRQCRAMSSRMLSRSFMPISKIPLATTSQGSNFKEGDNFQVSLSPISLLPFPFSCRATGHSFFVQWVIPAFSVSTRRSTWQPLRVTGARKPAIWRLCAAS